MLNKTCRFCSRSAPQVTFSKHRAVCGSCRGKQSRGTLEHGVYREDPRPHHGAPPVSPLLDELEVDVDTSLLDLVRLTRRGPVSFEELCNKLDLSPERLRALVTQAKSQNLVIAIDGDHVGFTGVKPREEIQEVDVKSTVGGRRRVACISDTHLGSKYCLRAQLIDFIRYAYGTGVREILHSGDIVDGCYDHGKFELSHVGLDEQVRDLYETLPRLPGLTYHAIGGNHDGTFTSESGVDVPLFIRDYFGARGRTDWFAYGNRGARLNVHGAIFDLWHPSGGVAYAQSYKMQKRLEAYAPGFKPQVCQVGHWHQHATVTSRGVFAFSAGTFQGSGSAFSKSLTGGPPAIGGTILSWDATEDGTLRGLIWERRNYYENERPTDLTLA